MTHEEFTQYKNTNILYLAYIFYTEKNRKSELNLDFQSFSNLFAQYEMMGFVNHQKFNAWILDKERQYGKASQ